MQKSFIGSNWIPDRQEQFISVDILGPFNNNDYMLMIIDHLSRHIELHPVSKITTDTVTNHLFYYMCSYGRPCLILTDLGISRSVSNI